MGVWPKSYEPDKQRDRRESRQEIDEFRFCNDTSYTPVLRSFMNSSVVGDQVMLVLVSVALMNWAGV